MLDAKKQLTVGISGALAVALGALGAHYLKNKKFKIVKKMNTVEKLLTYSAVFHL